jgi:Holliday junction resolvasome RuvABC endonuclease subunit
MKVIGIDYSMTTPAITVMSGEKIEIHYLTSVKRHQTDYRLSDSFVIHGTPQYDYHCQEDRFDRISEWAVRICDIEPNFIIIEDYAMGAKGKVFHIAENCGLLKHKLWKRRLPFRVIAPTALKKFAQGKGNADKCMMHDAFFAKTGHDLRKAMDNESKDCGSPVSDVVDSYFLAMFAKNAVDITH